MEEDKAVQENNKDLLPSFITEDMLRDFLAEANEGIQGMELEFIALEKNPNNTELIDKIFRVIHSIKGAASFISFKNLEGISHKTEDVLNKLRKSELQLNPCIMDTLLSSVDIIKLILKDIEENKNDIHINTKDILSKLTNIVATCKEISGITQEHGASTKALQKEEKKTPVVTPTSQPYTKENVRSIRINVERLDYLFNLIGELVLSRNRNMQLQRLLCQRYPNDEIINLDLLEAGSYLNRLTSEIQLAVMKTRMVPISTVFNKFQRIVRDMAKSLDKEVEIYISGEDTEIDKNIIDGISDPLLHIIRNSIDHGIEMPWEREAGGKPPCGRIELRSYYEGNYVIISIKDDGKGIDLDAVRKKAIEKGMIKAEGAERLSKNTLLNFIFTPGFSTVKNVTATSGRGVGMDVVNNNMEKLRGQITIDSDYGLGTEIKLKIPLTLAILETLIMNTSDLKYAIPLSNVVETHRVIYGLIERVRGSMVLRMRDELVPIVLLSEIMNIPYKYDNDDEVTIVVLKHGMLRMGLIVDETFGQEEVVIKPLDCLEGIAEQRGLSGATILGDGSITFILDVDALMKMSNAVEKQIDAEGAGHGEMEQFEINIINVVLVDDLGKEQYAIPARKIKEIESIQKADIDDLGGRLVTKYRGRIIPLITLPSITGLPAQHEFEQYYMVILTNNGRDAGLLVGRLLGIKRMEESLINKDEKMLQGIIGSSIFTERITFLLNIEDVINLLTYQ